MRKIVRSVTERVQVLPRDGTVPGLMVVHIERFAAGNFHNAHESSTAAAVRPVAAAQAGVACGFRRTGRKVNAVAEHLAGDSGIRVQFQACAEDI